MFFEPEVAATLSVGGEEVRCVVMRRDTDLLATVADERALSVITDPVSRQVRGILRDWEEAVPATLGLTDSVDDRSVRGLGEAVRLER